MEMNASSVGYSDAGALLTPMLQRIETEKCQARHVLVRRVNAKDAALVLWPVAPCHENDS
jgi:hypothetical protein